MLSAITNLEFAAPDAPDYTPEQVAAFLDELGRDPIATIRSLINAVGFLFLIFTLF